jgi:hypothetical protein
MALGDGDGGGTGDARLFHIIRDATGQEDAEKQGEEEFEAHDRG